MLEFLARRAASSCNASQLPPFLVHPNLTRISCIKTCVMSLTAVILIDYYIILSSAHSCYDHSGSAVSAIPYVNRPDMYVD